MWDGGVSAPDLSNRNYCPEGTSGIKFEADAGPGGDDVSIESVAGDVDVDPVVEDGSLCGDVEITDDATIREARIEGDLDLAIEGGNVTVEDSVIDGDVFGSGGVVELHGVTVRDKVFTGDARVKLGGGTVVEGGLLVDGDGNVECSGEATIDGQDCSEYTS